jgi:hypothetical protein
MTDHVRFDDSLPEFARIVELNWGNGAVKDNLFLRDASGKLTFVVSADGHSADDRAALAGLAVQGLGAYVDGDGFAVATPQELFDDTLTDPEAAISIELDHPRFKGRIRLIDRRMVGADWLRTPLAVAPVPARFVFASLKGGVGRSTALCVLAAHLASTGRRVLAIDMDLEAPGLGNLLLPDSTLPEFGLLDYLVESEVGNALEDEFFADLVGHSWLGRGKGRVDVIPALGHLSLLYPSNVLAKIARAYLAGPGNAGSMITFSDHMRNLLERFSSPLHYDAVLIDARAGLHETTASAILGLGADVCLFGIDQPQTYAGYELMFSHLAMFSEKSLDQLRYRLHLIQSKATKDPRGRTAFSNRMGSLVERYLWRPPVVAPATTDPAELTNTFEVDWTDENSDSVELLINEDKPFPPVAILDDEEFRSFDPLANRDLLGSGSYSRSFGEFLDMAETVIAMAAVTDDRDSQA